jgi:cyclase
MKGPQQGAPQGTPPGPQAGPLKIHQLTPSVYWVEGGVGNCGFIVGEKGVIVIDTTISPASAKELLANIARITPEPVTTIIITHGDMDHIGGLAAFPTGLTIIAQEDTRRNMEAAVTAGLHMVSPDHLPNWVVTTNREAAQIEGVRLELLHWAPAHTSGDLVVYLPEASIVFTGDIFAMDQPVALIHRERQGSSEGWLRTAKGVIALDADRFVVGHGEVQTKESLQKRTRKAEAEREKIKELVAAGMSLQQIQAADGDPPPSQSKPGPGGPRFTAFSEVVYQELAEYL